MRRLDLRAHRFGEEGVGVESVRRRLSARALSGLAPSRQTAWAAQTKTLAPTARASNQVGRDDIPEASELDQHSRPAPASPSRMGSADTIAVGVCIKPVNNPGTSKDAEFSLAPPLASRAMPEKEPHHGAGRVGSGRIRETAFGAAAGPCVAGGVHHPMLHERLAALAAVDGSAVVVTVGGSLSFLRHLKLGNPTSARATA